MKLEPIALSVFARTVVAVPPLAWTADLSLNQPENCRLIHHLESGGISILMYGGNANFYHLTREPYEASLEMLATRTSPSTWVIPSAGPAFCDLAWAGRVLRRLAFPAAMLLPSEVATSGGVARAVNELAEAFQGPIILYIRREGYVDPDVLARLVEDGRIWLVKYGVVAAQPANDNYLESLVGALGGTRILSGSGEVVAQAHFSRFKLLGFSSGCATIAPALSVACRAAIGSESAELQIAAFEPVERLRECTHPIVAMHEAVSLAGIADMGPILPPLGPLGQADRPALEHAVRDLLVLEKAARAGAAATH